MSDATATYQVPLSRDDAATIEHTVECRVLAAAHPSSTMEDVERYGECRRWITDLLQGRPVVIAESALAESRRIMTKPVPETPDA